MNLDLPNLLLSQAVLELEQENSNLEKTTEVLGILKSTIGEENQEVWISPLFYILLEETLRDTTPNILLKTIHDVKMETRKYLKTPTTSKEAKTLQAFLINLGTNLIKNDASRN